MINNGFIEIVGKEYMLTAKVYEALKSDVKYIDRAAEIGYDNKK